VDRAARAAQGRITIPKRFSLGVREMFAAQPRLEQPRGRRALRMLEQPRFRAGFDLLLLRADMGLAIARSRDWWTQVQEVSQTDRDRMADALAASRAAGEGRRWRRRPAPPARAADARPRPHERRPRQASPRTAAGCRPMSASAAISTIRARR
jgi:poly(A) polymerase